jgi:hypothetical protein
LNHRIERFSTRTIALAFGAAIVLCALTASAAVNGPGPPVSVYETTFNGTTTGPTGSDPAHFNTTVWGSAAPPAASLLANTSTYNGALINQLTAGNQFAGTQLWTCTAALFTYCTGTQAVASTVGNNTQVFEFAIVQSWPFYVDSGASSNVNPGAFTAETTSDDGSWLVLGPTALSYAQPANFRGVTGLTAGTAMVENSADQAPTSKTGTFTVARQAGCGDNLYWLTMEYDEAEGGDAQIEYSWQPPGAGALGRVTQGVVFGQVRYTGTGTAGESVQVTDPNGGTQRLLWLQLRRLQRHPGHHDHRHRVGARQRLGCIDGELADRQLDPSRFRFSAAQRPIDKAHHAGQDAGADAWSGDHATDDHADAGSGEPGRRQRHGQLRAWVFPKGRRDVHDLLPQHRRVPGARRGRRRADV